MKLLRITTTTKWAGKMVTCRAQQALALHTACIKNPYVNRCMWDPMEHGRHFGNLTPFCSLISRSQSSIHSVNSEFTCGWNVAGGLLCLDCRLLMRFYVATQITMAMSYICVWQLERKTFQSILEAQVSDWKCVSINDASQQSTIAFVVVLIGWRNATDHTAVYILQTSHADEHRAYKHRRKKTESIKIIAFAFVLMILFRVMKR